MSDSRVEILAAHRFMEGTRFEGAVEVVRRASDRGPRIDLRFRVGRRYVPLSRRAEEEVIQALRSGFGDATTAYRALLEEMNKKD